MLTVLIATYNGEKTLPSVLNAYCKLSPLKEEWKLVIIDNGSKDNTKEIISGFAHALPITLINEPKRGKNAALNRGLSEIEGDLVVFTDDDVLPHADWLNQIRLAADAQRSYSIFGGPVLPKWEFQPEDWILSWVDLKPTFSILDDVKAEGPIENFLIFGPNMALRSTIIKMGYTFDEAIGPKGLQYAQGSETQLLMKLHRAGYRAWHCKNAVVRHMIRSSQMKKQWVLKRAIRFGRGQYRLGFDCSNCKSYFQGIPRPLFKRILKRVYHVGKAKLSKNDENIFRERWNLNYHLGVALEARLLYKEKKRQ